MKPMNKTEMGSCVCFTEFLWLLWKWPISGSNISREMMDSFSLALQISC